MYRFCSISVNAIASRLVKNGVYDTKDRATARLVLKEVSDLWRRQYPLTKNLRRIYV